MTGATPLKLAPNSYMVTAVFRINIFVFFGINSKFIEFTVLHDVLSEFSKKSILPIEIPFFVIFLIKNKVVPLVFFQILIKINGL